MLARARGPQHKEVESTGSHAGPEFQGPQHAILTKRQLKVVQLFGGFKVQFLRGTAVVNLVLG